MKPLAKPPRHRSQRETPHHHQHRLPLVLFLLIICKPFVLVTKTTFLSKDSPTLGLSTDASKSDSPTPHVNWVMKDHSLILQNNSKEQY